MIEQYIDVNLVPGGIEPVLHVSQYDTGGRAFHIRVYDNGKQIALDGKDIHLVGERPDGGFFEQQASISDNTAIIDCTDKMTEAYGITVCSIEIKYGDSRTYTENIILDVERKYL